MYVILFNLDTNLRTYSLRKASNLNESLACFKYDSVGFWFRLQSYQSVNINNEPIILFKTNDKHAKKEETFCLDANGGVEDIKQVVAEKLEVFQGKHEEYLKYIEIDEDEKVTTESNTNNKDDVQSAAYHFMSKEKAEYMSIVND